MHPTPRERRIARRLVARGQKGLAEKLFELRGTRFGFRYRFETLYAVGGEGAVYMARDLKDPTAPLHVAKIPLLPLHRPFQMSSDAMRRKRRALREEGRMLEDSGSVYMPESMGVYHFENPLLDPARGDAFEEPEPVLLMERLPGRDLDLWLARIHRSSVPVPTLRRNLDRVAVVLLQALTDLQSRDYIYADLRPGNLRMIGRPKRCVRLLDAGSLVHMEDGSGRFPHVPAYLPPEVFQESQRGRPIVPSVKIQAVMAGRTLYEVATGVVPMPGQPVDRSKLKESHVSEPVADVVDGLCVGDFANVSVAIRYLHKRAKRRIKGGAVAEVNALPARPVGEPATAPPDRPSHNPVTVRRRILPDGAAATAVAEPEVSTGAAPAAPMDPAVVEPEPSSGERGGDVLPESPKASAKPKQGLFGRILSGLFGK